MVDFSHEFEQPADLPRRKALAREPMQVIGRKVSYQATLVLAKRHLQGDQLNQVVGFHTARIFTLSAVGAAARLI